MGQFTQLLVYVVFTMIGYAIASQVGGLIGFIIGFIVLRLLERRSRR